MLHTNSLSGLESCYLNQNKENDFETEEAQFKDDQIAD